MMITLAAMAHPGHGTTDGLSALHYLTEPVHVAGGAFMLALCIGIAAIGLRAWLRSRPQR